MISYVNNCSVIKYNSRARRVNTVSDSPPAEQDLISGIKSPPPRMRHVCKAVPFPIVERMHVARADGTILFDAPIADPTAISVRKPLTASGRPDGSPFN